MCEEINLLKILTCYASKGTFLAVLVVNPVNVSWQCKYLYRREIPQWQHKWWSEMCQPGAKMLIRNIPVTVQMLIRNIPIKVKLLIRNIPMTVQMLIRNVPTRSVWDSKLSRSRRRRGWCSTRSRRRARRMSDRSTERRYLKLSPYREIWNPSPQMSVEKFDG